MAKSNEKTAAAAARPRKPRKRLSTNRFENGLFLHSNPPRALSMQLSEIRRWIRAGDLDKLENVILDGQGQKLLSEFSSDVRTQEFLKTVPAYMARLDILHESVARGRLWDVKLLLGSKGEGDNLSKNAARLVLSKDRYGLGLLHKAVKRADLQTIDWLIENYPNVIHVRDKDRRTALHFCGVSGDPEGTWRRLADAGADPAALDAFARTPAFYMHRPDQFHAHQPRRYAHQHTQPNNKNLKHNVPIQVRPANIRTWIHDQNLGKLKRVLWEGQGDKLRMETSAHPAVRKFLAAVPYIMGIIKDTHHATVHNNLQMLKRKTADPVPPEILLSKDTNGLNPLHKAAGLGFTDVVRYIVDRCPEAVTRLDNEGRTPLHYAAIQKDGQQIFNMLQNVGGDQKIFDSRGKTASYYKLKPNELDMKLLQTIPSAPRNSSVMPSGWSWELFNDWESGPSTHSNSQKSEDSTFKPEDASQNDISDYKNEPESNGLHLSDTNGTQVKDKEMTVDENRYGDSNNNETNSEHKALDKSLELHALEGISHKSNTSSRIKARDSSNINLKKDTPADVNGKISALHERISKSISSNDSGNRRGTNTHGGHSDSETSLNESEKERFVKLEDEFRDEHIKNVSKENSENNNIIVLPPPADMNTDKQEDNEEDSKSGDRQNDANKPNDSPKKETVQNVQDSENSDVSVYKRRQSATHDGSPSPKKENTLEDNNNNNTEGKKSPAQATEDEHDHGELHNLPNEGANTRSHLHKHPNEGANTQSNLHSHPNEGTEEHSDSQDTPTEDNGPTREENLLKIVDDELRENQELTSQVFESVKKKQGPESEELAEITSNSTRYRSISAIPPAPPIGETVVREFDNGVEMTDREEVTEELEKASLESRQHAQQLVQEADLEKLAEMVLSGQGTALLGLTSQDPRVNSFLEAVPSYLRTIDSVHKACMRGDLRGLGLALTRRNLAVARDGEAYFKPTPLHVATLFEHGQLLEYLAARFPETLHARDAKGRTALHYAATLPDPQHRLYQALLRLGADPTLPDEEGYNPDQYLKNRHLLQHSYLMEIYRRQNAAEKNETQDSEEKKPPTPKRPPSIGNLQIFGAEDGRYLSQTVGGPLIKGLTEVVNVRPKNPVKYLGNFLVNYEEKSGDTDEKLQKGRFEIVASTSRPAIMSSADKNKGYNLQKSKSSSGLKSPTSSHSIQIRSNFNPIARDEFGQSMVHLAAARPHSRNAFYELLIELDSNISLRDALYRTARDIAVLASKIENAVSIDKYVLYLVAKGEIDKLRELMLDGYDHLADLETPEPPQKVAEDRGHEAVVALFDNIKSFQEKRDAFHGAIRVGDEAKVEEMVKENPGTIRDLAVAKNIQSRCSLHVALLAQAEDIVKFLVERFPQTLRIGDNLERTPLHYAMALNKVEMVSNILIQAGAERVAKDLKGRQPSYYFMNKSDIHELQEEEKQLREQPEEQPPEG
nr:PREDICTED: uncharacterized protein LOC109035602 isoform X1 [Bemisia tabaci]